MALIANGDGTYTSYPGGERVWQDPGQGWVTQTWGADGFNQVESFQGDTTVQERRPLAPGANTWSQGYDPSTGQPYTPEGATADYNNWAASNFGKGSGTDTFDWGPVLGAGAAAGLSMLAPSLLGEAGAAGADIGLGGAEGIGMGAAPGAGTIGAGTPFESSWGAGQGGLGLDASGFGAGASAGGNGAGLVMPGVTTAGSAGAAGSMLGIPSAAASGLMGLSGAAGAAGAAGTGAAGTGAVGAGAAGAGAAGGMSTFQKAALGLSALGTVGGIASSMNKPDIPNASPTAGGAGGNIATLNPNNPVLDPSVAKQAQDAAYANWTARLDPQWGQATNMKETALRNQGLVPGGEGYDAAMRDFNFGKNDAYSQAYNNSYSQGLAAQGQGFNQAATNAGLTNQAANINNTFNQGTYNANVGAQNAMTSGLFGLGGTALSAYGMSQNPYNYGLYGVGNNSSAMASPPKTQFYTG